MSETVDKRAADVQHILKMFDVIANVPA